MAVAVVFYWYELRLQRPSGHSPMGKPVVPWFSPVLSCGISRLINFAKRNLYGVMLIGPLPLAAGLIQLRELGLLPEQLPTQHPAEQAQGPRPQHRVEEPGIDLANRGPDNLPEEAGQQPHRLGQIPIEDQIRRRRAGRASLFPQDRQAEHAEQEAPPPSQQPSWTRRG